MDATLSGLEIEKVSGRENRNHLPDQEKSVTNIKHDVLTLCLRLCLEPTFTMSKEVLDVLERYRPAWEAAAGGMDYDQSLALIPEEQANG